MLAPGPDGAAAAATAFARYDSDGSGALDIAELCAALRSVAPGPLGDDTLRLLLAYCQVGWASYLVVPVWKMCYCFCGCVLLRHVKMS